MDVLCYLVYGPSFHLDEVRYAILSAQTILDSQSSNPCQIVLYTDNATAAFRDLPVHLEVKTHSVFAEWMGPLGFNHRAKIFAIQDALSRFGDRVVYCDSDTYFLKPPDQLFSRIRPGTSFMHVCEGHLSESNGAGLGALLNRNQLRTVTGQRWKLTDNELMFNAGVIGMHRADIGLLHEVLYLTDQIYRQVKIHTVEQFAFSACLNRYTRLTEAHDVVHHYWPMPGRGLFLEELKQVLHDPALTSDEERWQRLLSLRPTPNTAHFTQDARDRIRSLWKREIKRAGVLEPIKVVLGKMRGSDAA